MCVSAKTNIMHVSVSWSKFICGVFCGENPTLRSPCSEAKHPNPARTPLRHQSWDSKWTFQGAIVSGIILFLIRKNEVNDELNDELDAESMAINGD